MEKSKNDLDLILNSSAEAIFGIDLDGNCAFCNKSCIELLGYNDQSELLGNNMHSLIHHSHRDGSPFPEYKCKIINVLTDGEKLRIDEEVFWRADGSCFDVEYMAHPKITDGKITGAVITFMDISKRKQKEAEIQYLYCYDTLTGVHNRRCVEENSNKIDIPENLPLSVILGDVNGLKMTNDIFGHTAGDNLIRKSADILKQLNTPDGMVSRMGGDEFIMPKTPQGRSLGNSEKIKSGFTNEQVVQ